MEVQTVSEKSKGYVWILLGVPVLFALLALQNAQAAPVSISALQYAGTGCSSANVSDVDVSKRVKTLSFNGFKAGSAAGQLRASCNMALPVTIPNGYQVALSASFKGYIKGDGRLVRSYGSSLNPNGASFTSKLASVRGKGYSQIDNVSTQWSACGRDSSSLNLRLNSSIQVLNNTSSMKVDKMTVRLNVRPCR